MTQTISDLSYFKNIYPRLSESRFLNEVKGSYPDDLDENDELDEDDRIKEVGESNDYDSEEEQEEFEYDEEEF